MKNNNKHCDYHHRYKCKYGKSEKKKNEKKSSKQGMAIGRMNLTRLEDQNQN